MKVDQHYEDSYRSEVVSPLMDAIKRGNCRTVVSVRGMGLGPLFKFIRFHSSIREKLLKGQNVQFSLINFDEIPPTDQKRFLKELLRDLRSILVANAVEKNEFIEKQYAQGIVSEDDHEVLYVIKHLLQVAVDSNITIVVLLQEFDEAVKQRVPLLNTLFSLHELFDPHLLYIFGVHIFPDRLRKEELNKFDYVFYEYIVETPFTQEGYLRHYKTHFAESGLYFSEEQLKLLHEYTGGFAAYNRFFGNSLIPSDLENLEKAILELSLKPKMILHSRIVITDLFPEEVQVLKHLASGKQVDSSKTKSLQDLGLVTSSGKLFSKIFATHLTEDQKDESGLRVDSEAKKVYVDNVELSLYLSPIEFKFLSFLYDNRNKVCEREEVIEFAWGGNPEGVSDEAVDQLVSRLRSKLLAQSGRSDLVTTVRGHGFTVNQPS